MTQQEYTMLNLSVVERAVMGIEFFCDQCEIEAVEPNNVMINGATRREMDEDDYMDVRQYGACTSLVQHMIEMDTDGEVELLDMDDIDGNRRLFLVFVNSCKPRKPRTYVHDALNDVLHTYQNKNRSAASELKWHKVLMRDRSFIN